MIPTVTAVRAHDPVERFFAAMTTNLDEFVDGKRGRQNAASKHRRKGNILLGVVEQLQSRKNIPYLLGTQQ